MTNVPSNSYADVNATLLRVQHFKIGSADSTRVYPILLESTPERRAIDAAQRASAQEAQIAFDNRPSQTSDNNDLNLPNILSLDPEKALAIIDIVKVMISGNESDNRNVRAFKGNETTSSLETYLSWLNEYVGDEHDDGTYSSTIPALLPSTERQANDETSKPVGKTDVAHETLSQEHVYLPNVSSLTTDMASAVYRQVQDMIERNLDDGKIVHGFDGNAKTSSIDTYREWLAIKAGITTI